MRLTELDFIFPEELIAQEPAEPRDSCRLMYLPSHGAAHHTSFADLPGLLRAGDTVVFNDSRVLPARLEATKPTGGKVEVLFLHREGGDPGRDHPAEETAAAPQRDQETWEVLARPSHRLREGGTLLFPGGEESVLSRRLGDGRWLLSALDGALSIAMERYGRLPLPPYIRHYSGEPEAYQTVYAAHPGSAAAPTAGLHFTPGVLQALSAAGVESAYVTLHVGLDTFQPIREMHVEEHRIHREAYSLTHESLTCLRDARSRQGRLVAVGTTAARVLETLAADGLLDVEADASRPHHKEAISGTSDIFITPGYRFQAVDLLLTNFHLPRSTVLALVMAFSGVERIRDAYREAIELRYRFFSFGDAMLVERNDDHGAAARTTLRGRDGCRPRASGERRKL